MDSLWRSPASTPTTPARCPELSRQGADLYRSVRPAPAANHALRCAIDEIRYHDVDCAIVGAVPILPVELHAMALMGGHHLRSFNEDPQRASRPVTTPVAKGSYPRTAAAPWSSSRRSPLARGAGSTPRSSASKPTRTANHPAAAVGRRPEPLMSKLLKMTGHCPRRDRLARYLDAARRHHRAATIRTGVRRARLQAQRSTPPSRCSATCWSAPVVEVHRRHPGR